MQMLIGGIIGALITLVVVGVWFLKEVCDFWSHR